MVIKLIAVGKTNADYLKTGIQEYAGRLQHYLRFEYIEIPDIKVTKGMNEEQVKSLEGEALLKHISPGAHLVLLDENGQHYTSVSLAKQLQKRFNSGGKVMVFAIGGPYGFSDAVYQRASEKLALSKLTFSHQMARLIALEQLYRAMTILRNEPYHHA